MSTSVLESRIDRWRSDLLTPLANLYPEPERVAERLLAIVEKAYAARSAELHELDARRQVEPDWFQLPSALGYAAYADRYAGTLRGVEEHVDHLVDLGVTYLHLMPLLQPRPAPNDGGYAVQDYGTVRADLGTMTDLSALADTLREHGIALCLDLVLNHVAKEHAWAQAAQQRRRAEAPLLPRLRRPHPARRLRAVAAGGLPRLRAGQLHLGRTSCDGWVWTTFNDYQWDLNWANPDVLCEFAEIILDLANAGVEVFRLDAIAFVWKRLGTNCQNQPEVHDLTQVLRTVARIAAPAVVFKAEAIVGPHDLPAYLGVGEHAGKVSDLAYHNSLMVQVWSMLAAKDVRLATHALQQLPQPPSTTSWITYLRCHDDIGWAIDDGDAAAVGLDGFAHRRFLSDWYSGEFPGSWAQGLVFQENPDTGDRRISGALASLAGLELGDPDATRRILLAHAVILGFGGLPVVWMGDELGLLNDPHWAEEPGHSADNRWVHRQRMPWPLPGDEHGVRTGLGRLLEARRGAAAPARRRRHRDLGPA